MRDGERQAGFMLVEVLAALVVTAAIVAVVLPFAGNLLMRWWTGQPEIERADGFMQAVARLGDDLAQAVPLTITGGAPGMRWFRCDPRSLDFVRPSLGADARTSLDVVTYRIVEREDGDQLLRASRPYRPEDGPPAAGQAAGPGVAILEGALTLRFAAVGRDGRPEDLWQDLKEMPRRVELAARRRRRNDAGGALVAAPVSKIVFPLGAAGG